MTPSEWYYAKGSKQSGPVSAAELKQLADRGEISSEDMIWRPGMDDWVSARKVKGLFDAEQAPSAQTSAAQNLAAQTSAASPNAATVRAPEPMTAKTTEPPTRKTPELPDAVPAEAPSRGGPVRNLHAAFERSPAAFERARESDSRHLFDYLLEGARARFSAPFVKAGARLFALNGLYGLYVAMAALLAFHLIHAVKSGQYGPLLRGLALAAALVVLQYCAGRLSGTLAKMERIISGQVSSTALFDCLALILILGGLIALVRLTLLAIYGNDLSLIVPAVGVFIICQFAALFALNPETLNLSIAPDVRVSEEALGILTGFAMLTLRVVPVVFGVGVIWGTLWLGQAAYRLFLPGDLGGMEGIGGSPTGGIGSLSGGWINLLGGDPRFIAAQTLASSATRILLFTAALPLLAYFLFLFGYLIVEVLRGLVSLAGKLDQAMEKRDE